MSFSTEWDERYRENTHLSVWPWSDVVSLVKRHCKHLDVDRRVLELGCGAGANIPFFQALGVQYHAVEGSPSMVARLHERFPTLRWNIVAGDFTREQPFAPGFDLVIDRAALTHNDTDGINSGLKLAHAALRAGGYFIGVDWFSTRYSEYQGGTAGPDAYTRCGYTEGPFQGTGNVHFSDESHLRLLFAQYTLLLLEEKISREVIPASSGQFAAWNVVARRQ
jgi:SAM-dependent methyltransferase